MQFILLLLLVFTIGCVLYGISAGVQAIRRSTVWLTAQNNRNGDPTDNATPVQLTRAPLNKVQASNSLGSQSSIDELKTLFDLHQQGALTTEEFKDMKQHLLRSLRSTPSGC